MEQRNYKADNIRFFLIFTVVFAHMLEWFSGERADWLYRLIYTFHMGAFIFLTGYFAKYNARKILLSLVWPYFLFQTLYQLFYGYIIKGSETVELSYTTPHWILWYLMAVIFYYLLIPVLQQEKTLDKVLVFAGSAAVSLLAGMDKTIGYYMTLSRFFCYLPFFVAGYYLGHRPKERPLSGGKPAKAAALAACVLFLLLAEAHVLGNPELFRRNVLYGSYSYAAESYTWAERALLQGVGFGWIALLFLVMPGKKLPVVSLIGGNTLPVFLFHGFLIRLMGKWKVFQYSETENLLLALGLTVGILLLFGNPVSARICKWFFTGHWASVLFGRRKKQNAAP